jgi:hypothetical protein
LYQSPFNYILWTQPGGPGTTVYPQQENAIYDPPQNPIPPGIFFSESSGLWFAGCGHNYDALHIFMDYDTDTGTQAAVGCCPLCSYIQLVISPYSAISDMMMYPIIVS